MKSKVSERPLFSETIPMDDVENVGIMQGFMDGEYDEDDGDDDEDFQAEKMMGRQPNSPEILMNNLRGDMRSIDARVEELADLVGFNAAAETPQDVLALLQPVFAAQQAPAMPQAMPQGGIPQEGMPQEMMGGMPPEMMGGMPQEMPPEMMGGMPPEMPQEMPPEMMGGIGALPADQGPGMAEPVMMANGGPVQYFRDGTDEDGVTPIDDTSSMEEMFALMGGDPFLMGGGAPSSSEVAAARQRQLARAREQALPVPDLKSEVERRTPMYEELMGVDRDLSQAQILFELGQRAFNFGANVDDQGRPLRGSAAARLAGAVRTLPGSIGQITGQMDQQRRAVRGAALQASERNIENMLLNRTRADVAQTQADARILNAASVAAGKVPKGKSFGTGMPGAAQTFLAQLAPSYADGSISPDDKRIFESSLKIATQPETYTDTRLNREVTRRPELPDYVIEAVRLHELNKAGITPSLPSAGSVGTSDIPQEVEDKVRKLAAQHEANRKKRDKGEMSNEDFYNSSSELQMQIDQATAAISERPRGFIEPAKDTPAVKDAPKDTLAAKDAPKKKSDKKASSPFENMSLVNLTDFVTGPGPSFKRGVSNVPGLGSSFPDTTQATAFYETAINRIVTALKTTDRFGNMERTEIKKELGLDPALYQDGALLKNKLFGLGDFIKQQRDESKRLSERTDINVDISKSAEVTLQEMNRALEIVYGKGPEGMPVDGVVSNKPIKVYSIEELEGLPPGTRILWNGVEPHTVR